MSEQSLEKRAALVIRTLQQELQESEVKQQEQTAQLEHYKRAQRLATRFLKVGHVTLEKFEEMVKDFCEQPSEQLDVIEKAAAMAENGNESFLGKVAEDISSNSLTPEQRFVQGLLED